MAKKLDQAQRFQDAKEAVKAIHEILTQYHKNGKYVDSLGRKLDTLAFTSTVSSITKHTLLYIPSVAAND